MYIHKKGIGRNCATKRRLKETADPILSSEVQGIKNKLRIERATKRDAIKSFRKREFAVLFNLPVRRMINRESLQMRLNMRQYVIFRKKNSFSKVNSF